MVQICFQNAFVPTNSYRKSFMLVLVYYYIAVAVEESSGLYPSSAALRFAVFLG